MQTLNILGVYLTHLHYLPIYPKNFQRTKLDDFVDIIFCQAADLSLCPAGKVVGPDGLEPSTPRLSSACSNQLSYEPMQAVRISDNECHESALKSNLCDQSV